MLVHLRLQEQYRWPTRSAPVLEAASETMLNTSHQCEGYNCFSFQRNGRMNPLFSTRESDQEDVSAWLHLNILETRKWTAVQGSLVSTMLLISYWQPTSGFKLQSTSKSNGKLKWKHRLLELCQQFLSRLGVGTRIYTSNKFPSHVTVAGSGTKLGEPLGLEVSEVLPTKSLTEYNG